MVTTYYVCGDTDAIHPLRFAPLAALAVVCWSRKTQMYGREIVKTRYIYADPRKTWGAG